MQFTATIKKGSVYKKWMQLNRQGGTIHGTAFTRLHQKRNTIFVAHDIVDLDALKNDPNIILEMTTITVHPDELHFVPDALSQGIVPSRDATDNPAHTTREDVPADFVEPSIEEYDEDEAADDDGEEDHGHDHDVVTGGGEPPAKKRVGRPRKAS